MPGLYGIVHGKGVWFIHLHTKQLDLNDKRKMMFLL